jgi:hypothetical protein
MAMIEPNVGGLPSSRLLATLAMKGLIKAAFIICLFCSINIVEFIDSLYLHFSEHLQKPLEKYFRDYPKVKIVRSPERGGLTKARIRGFDVSTGEVVVFLDSHIECTEGENCKLQHDNKMIM